MIAQIISEWLPHGRGISRRHCSVTNLPGRDNIHAFRDRGHKGSQDAYANDEAEPVFAAQLAMEMAYAGSVTTGERPLVRADTRQQSHVTAAGELDLASADPSQKQEADPPS